VWQSFFRKKVAIKIINIENQKSWPGGQAEIGDNYFY
jgi:hypothetical protein